MNGTSNDFTFKYNSICITCLTNTHYLNPMSFTYRNEYKKIVELDKEDIEMRMCNICCWQFRRFLKFKQQCQEARTVLTDAVKVKLNLCHNLEKTKTEVYYFPETHHVNQSANRVKTPVDNPLMIRSRENNPMMDAEQFTSNPLTVNSSQTICSLEKLQDEEVTNTDYDEPLVMMKDNDTDYDEVPLVMLRENGKGKKRKRRKNLLRKNGKKQLESVKAQDVQSKRVKKELKEGFTSRMVQETNEYVVIKLTKEQVLQEMEERSKSEAYLQSPFKCEKCVKGYNFQDVLTTHLERHTVEIGSFQCDMCSQYCRSAVSLRGHVKSHTTRYKCKLCDVVRVSRQHLVEHHAISHTVQPLTYTCDTCHYSTNKRTVMQRHVKSHVVAPPHACHHCGKLFKSIDSLRVHTMRHDQSARVQCAECDVTFVYAALLRRHVARVHERRDFYCVECDAQFKSNESLRLHFKKAKKHRDSSSYKFSCSECTVSCVSASALQAHSARAHGAPRAHACAACARLYCSRDALRAHRARTHCEKAS